MFFILVIAVDLDAMEPQINTFRTLRNASAMDADCSDITARAQEGLLGPLLWNYCYRFIPADLHHLDYQLKDITTFN